MINLLFDGAIEVGKPKDWIDELDGNCGSLAIAVDQDLQSGNMRMHSIYRFTPEEIEALRDGGCFRLSIHGQRHPIIQACVLGPKVTARIDPKDGLDMGDIIEE